MCYFFHILKIFILFFYNTLSKITKLLPSKYHQLIFELLRKTSICSRKYSSSLQFFRVHWHAFAKFQFLVFGFLNLLEIGFHIGLVFNFLNTWYWYRLEYEKRANLGRLQEHPHCAVVCGPHTTVRTTHHTQLSKKTTPTQFPHSKIGSLLP